LLTRRLGLRASSFCVCPTKCRHASNIDRLFWVHDVINQMFATPTGVRSCRRFTHIASSDSERHTRTSRCRSLLHRTHGVSASVLYRYRPMKLPTPSATDVWYGLEHRLNRSTHADVRPIRSATHRFHRNATGAASGPLSIIPPITFRHSGTMRI
jgi:hypothetical protein